MDEVVINIIESPDVVSIGIVENIDQVTIIETGTRGDKGDPGPAGPTSFVFYDTISLFPAVGDASIAYCAKNTAIIYRWNGTTYIPISNGVTPVGLNKEVQFNDNGMMGSSADLKYDKDLKAVAIGEVYTFLPTNPLAIGLDVDSYLQMNIQNRNNGIHASSDFITTADIGSDSAYYTDMGINNSNFNDPAFPYGKALDSYLIGVGGNLILGAVEPNKEINFFAGSYSASSVKITGSGIVLPNGNTYKIGNFNITDLIAEANSKAQEDALFAAGTKIIIRTDLL